MAFKINLDEQRRRREQEIQQNKERDRSLEKEVMEAQARRDAQRHMTEEKKRQDIRENVRQKAKESIEEKERLKEGNRLKEEEQRKVEKQRYLDGQRQQAEFQKQQRDIYFRERQNYAQALTAQRTDKERSLKELKEADKVFAEQENKKMDQDALNREKHFAKMRDYQLKNDAKYNFYSNFKAMGSMKEAEKRDEELMIKQLAERDSKAELDMQRRRENEMKLKNEANRVLND